MGFIICPISTQVFRHEYTKQFFRFILWPIFLISVSIVIPILQMPVCFRTNIVLNNNEINKHFLKSIYYGITKFFVLLLLLCCLIGYPLCFARVRKLNLKDKVLGLYSQSSFFAEWSLYLIIDFYDMNSPYGILLTSSLVRRSVLPFKLFQNQNAIVPLIGNLRQRQDNRQVPHPSLVEPQAATTLSSIS